MNKKSCFIVFLCVCSAAAAFAQVSENELRAKLSSVGLVCSTREQTFAGALASGDAEILSLATGVQDWKLRCEAVDALGAIKTGRIAQAYADILKREDFWSVRPRGEWAGETSMREFVRRFKLAVLSSCNIDLASVDLFDHVQRTNLIASLDAIK